MNAVQIVADVGLVLGLAAVIACVWAPIWANDEACREAEEDTLPTPDQPGAGNRNRTINVYEKEEDSL